MGAAGTRSSVGRLSFVVKVPLHWRALLARTCFSFLVRHFLTTSPSSTRLCEARSAAFQHANAYTRAHVKRSISLVAARTRG